MGRRAKYFTLEERRAAERELQKKRDTSKRYVYGSVEVPRLMSGSYRGKARRQRYNARTYARAHCRRTKQSSAELPVGSQTSTAFELPKDMPEDLVELAFTRVDSYLIHDLRSLQGQLCSQLHTEGHQRALHCREGCVKEAHEDGLAYLEQLLHEWEESQTMQLFGSDEDLIQLEWLARHIYCLWDDLEMMENDAADLLCLYEISLLSWQSLTNLHLEYYGPQNDDI
ncbi:hypothetical protein OBBRIDRAFT_800279 [Obba rivulosa]|uniref:Uncharacterized protein n=1 Tax=Obba rivulosa TaxID=1052685 RepID=A0A8E2DUD0_9APHY|nr:hypothetical protein OBBRIDRAFT_800279 [Obba rivulosa]